MKVILLGDVKGLGKKGDVVDAKDGYARNYLIPKNLAVEATKENIEKNEQEKARLEAERQKEIEDAKALAETIGKITLLFKAKAADDGRLFGSITSKDIADKLKSEEGITVDKRKIELPEPIRYIGNMDVKIKLLPKVYADLKVKVEAEA